MNVREINLRRFMRYEEADVELPERGIVTVTGKNGQGKSTLVEAVAAALWDESVRGTSPWRPDEPGLARVSLSGVDGVEWVERHGGKKKALRWSGSSESYPTVTKATEALARHLPPYKIWRACSVFRKDSGALFSGATDSARKRLLEQVLGLERFDAALLACKADSGRAHTSVDALTRALSNLTSLLEREEEAVREAEETLAQQAPIAALEPVSPLVEERARFREALSETQRERDKLVRESATAKAEAERAQRERDRFLSGNCPTCDRRMPEDRLSSLRQGVETAQRGAEALAASLKAFESEVAAKVAAVRARAEALDARIAQAQEASRAAAAGEALRTRLSAQLAKSSERLERLRAEVDSAEAGLPPARAELRTLTAVERVLGYKGVRSAVLARALGGLEGAANAVLSKLAPPALELEVKPFRELKSSDGTAEEITISLRGAGGGHGTRGASDGEAKRVDVALLLALATVSEGVLGASPDLWFDEVFDGLDSDGAPALTELLAEMADTRKVVVISHNPDLLAALKSRATARFHVVDHKIRELRGRALI